MTKELDKIVEDYEFCRGRIIEVEKHLKSLKEEFNELSVKRKILEWELKVGHVYSYDGRECILETVKDDGGYFVKPYVRLVNKTGVLSKILTCVWDNKKLTYLRESL